MSCDLAATVFLFLAAAGPTAAPASAPSPVSVAQEPLYADIVRRASGLKRRAEAYRQTGAVADLDVFAADLSALSALDMKGHLDLAQRGVDGDLKCILKGISEDLPKRLDELKAAKAPAERDQALKDIIVLLDDNVAVITAPPAPPV